MNVSEFVRCTNGTDRYEVLLLPSDPRIFDIIDYLSRLEWNRKNGYFILCFPREYLPFVSEVAITNQLMSGSNCDTQKFQTEKHYYQSYFTGNGHKSTYDYRLEEGDKVPDFKALDELHQNGKCLIHRMYMYENKPGCPKTPQDKNQEEDNVKRIRGIHLYKTEVDDPASNVLFPVNKGVVEPQVVENQKVFCPCGCTTELPRECIGLPNKDLWKVVMYLEKEGNVPITSSVIEQIQNGKWKPRNDVSNISPPIPQQSEAEDESTQKQIKSKKVKSVGKAVAVKRTASAIQLQKQDSQAPRKKQSQESQSNASQESNADDTPRASSSQQRKRKRSQTFQYPFKFIHFYEKDSRHMNIHLNNASRNPLKTYEFIMECLRDARRFDSHYMVADEEIELWKTEDSKVELFHTETWVKRMNVLLRDKKGFVGEIPGINTWFTYEGGCGNGTQLHTEDFYLNSANILLGGEPKIWMFFPLAEMWRVRNKVKHYMIDYGICTAAGYRCLDHKSLVLDPLLLKLLGVDYRLVVQSVGEMVVTLAGAYHQVHNVGRNIGTAINFAALDFFELYNDLRIKNITQSILPCSRRSCGPIMDDKFRRLTNLGKNLIRNMDKLLDVEQTDDPKLNKLRKEIFEFNEETRTLLIKSADGSKVFQDHVRQKVSGIDRTFCEGRLLLEQEEKHFKLNWIEDGVKKTRQFKTLYELHNYVMNLNNPMFADSWDTTTVQIPEEELHAPSSTKSLSCICSGKIVGGKKKKEKVYESKSSLSNHIKNSNNPTRFRCKLCPAHDDKLFTKKFGLAQHLWATHFGSSMPCPVCHVRISAVESLTRHIEHPKKGQLECGKVISNWSKCTSIGKTVNVPIKLKKRVDPASTTKEVQPVICPENITPTLETLKREPEETENNFGPVPRLCTIANSESNLDISYPQPTHNTTDSGHEDDLKPDDTVHPEDTDMNLVISGVRSTTTSLEEIKTEENPTFILPDL